MGQGGAKVWGLRPRPAPYDRENSHPISVPLGPHETPAHPVKFYFLLIYPTTIFFLMKPISLIKIYLKLQLNLYHQIKSIFRKN